MDSTPSHKFRQYSAIELAPGNRQDRPMMAMSTFRPGLFISLPLAPSARTFEITLLSCAALFDFAEECDETVQRFRLGVDELTGAGGKRARDLGKIEVHPLFEVLAQTASPGVGRIQDHQQGLQFPSRQFVDHVKNAVAARWRFVVCLLPWFVQVRFDEVQDIPLQGEPRQPQQDGGPQQSALAGLSAPLRAIVLLRICHRTGSVPWAARAGKAVRDPRAWTPLRLVSIPRGGGSARGTGGAINPQPVAAPSPTFPWP